MNFDTKTIQYAGIIFGLLFLAVLLGNLTSAAVVNTIHQPK